MPGLDRSGRSGGAPPGLPRPTGRARARRGDPPWLVFEWYVVEAFARANEDSVGQVSKHVFTTSRSAGVGVVKGSASVSSVVQDAGGARRGDKSDDDTTTTSLSGMKLDGADLGGSRRRRRTRAGG